MSDSIPQLRRLATSAPPIGPRCWAARRINRLLARHAPHPRYLEIGLGAGLTLECVAARTRWGVDPSPRFDTSDLPEGVRILECTSDSFFETLDGTAEFDVVFVDGLHVFQQAYRDVLHSLRHLATSGSILIDDTVPCDEVSGIPDQDASIRRRRELGLTGTPWHGDVWKVVVAIATLHPELEYRTIVGSGNAQTLLWRARGHAIAHRTASHDELGRIDSLDYATTLGAGVPDMFRPCTEDEALRMRGA